MTDRFVSTKELEEARQRRQQEWEKVRKPGDPAEAPEEEVDHRSLYERLKEVRDKKQAEWDEEHKFKNMIRGLDTDETDFLSKVSDLRAKEDRRKKEEEEAILKEMNKSATTNVVMSEMPSVSQLKPPPTKSKGPKESKQAALIRTAIKRKSTSEGQVSEKKVSVDGTVSSRKGPLAVSAMKVIGVLPGIVHYSSSSDSDSTSDSNSDSTGDMPVLPVLVQSASEKTEKSKPQQPTENNSSEE